MRHGIRNPLGLEHLVRRPHIQPFNPIGQRYGAGR
jgi:hypothetical protein